MAQISDGCMSDETIDAMLEARRMQAAAKSLLPLDPLQVQVAGSHYKNSVIQPVEYITANKLNFLEGCIVKRITRWRKKPASRRFEDLEKIKHEVDLLIAMEQKYGQQDHSNPPEPQQSDNSAQLRTQVPIGEAANRC